MSQRSELDQLKHILDEAGVTYEIFSHAEQIDSAEDGVENNIGGLNEMAPTLILETEKGLLAAIISGDTRLSYKKIKKELGLKNVSLARPERVYEATGAEVGTVCFVNPGLLTIIDTRLADVVYGGCGIPHHTLRINRTDLIRVTQAVVFDFAEAKNSQCLVGDA
jgi:prolyl-tRNA editing enzyme YbaK/EbsC (Cys-tRNA(Pro) deacylase)